MSEKPNSGIEPPIFNGYKLTGINNHSIYDNNSEPINFEESPIYEFVTDKKPLCYHVFNMKRNKHCQNTLPFFHKIYNLSAMKMHQLAQRVGGCVKAIFTDTLIISNPEHIPEFNSDIIGGVRKSKIPESDLLLNTTPRTKTFMCERPEKKVLKKINEFKLTNNKGCYIKGKGGCGKSTLCNKLQAELGEGKYAVCTPTHKSTLKIGAVTIYNLFNIDTKTHTYVKSSVDKLQNSGVEWIFIDEISMINSKCWAVLNDIKSKYNFKFVLMGDFGQLDPIETDIYDVENSEVFANLVDCQVLEMLINYRAMNDPEYKLFLEDQDKVRDDKPFNMKTYSKKRMSKVVSMDQQNKKGIK
jgi:energy-coupling factor transporter ATP-binding protein EcfA2